MLEPWSGLIDAHCHICDEDLLPQLDNEVAEALQIGNTGFISSALSKEEFEWIELTRLHTYHKYFRWSAGIHPYYDKSSENDFSALVKLSERKKIIALGEIGLDGRKYNTEWQKEILLKQLDLASSFDLPVIFHVVYNFYDLYKLLENNFPKVRGFLHGFNNSLDVAEHFSQFDLAFSLGCKPPKPEVVKFIIKHGFFLFETDAPYQKPKSEPSQINHLKNLDFVVEEISRISALSREKLIQMQKASFDKIFSISRNQDF
jgi:TatD DNase family protein